jgi:hypothetical protein
METKSTKFMESLKSSSKGGRFQLWTLKTYSQPTCFDTTRNQEGFGFPYRHHTLFFRILIYIIQDATIDGKRVKLAVIFCACGPSKILLKGYDTDI